MCEVIFVLNSITGICCTISFILELVRLWAVCASWEAWRRSTEFYRPITALMGLQHRALCCPAFVLSFREVLASHLSHTGVADGECWQQRELLSWQCLSCWIWVKIPLGFAFAVWHQAPVGTHWGLFQTLSARIFTVPFHWKPWIYRWSGDVMENVHILNVHLDVIR